MAAEKGAVVESSVNVVEREKCGLDMSTYEDLPSVAAATGSVGGGEGKEKEKEVDYVFVNGSDAGSDDHVERECNGEVVNGDHVEVVSGDPGETGCNGEVNVPELEGRIDEGVVSSDLKVNAPELDVVSEGDHGVVRDKEVVVCSDVSETVLNEKDNVPELESGVEGEVEGKGVDSSCNKDDVCSEPGESGVNGMVDSDAVLVDVKGDEGELHVSNGDVVLIGADGNVDLDGEGSNGRSDEVEGVVEGEVGESEVGEVVGELVERCVEGEGLVKENGVTESESEVVCDDGQVEVLGAENGKLDNMVEGEGRELKVEDMVNVEVESEDLVGENDGVKSECVPDSESGSLEVENNGVKSECVLDSESGNLEAENGGSDTVEDVPDVKSGDLETSGVGVEGSDCTADHDEEKNGVLAAGEGFDRESSVEVTTSSVLDDDHDNKRLSSGIEGHCDDGSFQEDDAQDGDLVLEDEAVERPDDFEQHNQIAEPQFCEDQSQEPCMPGCNGLDAPEVNKSEEVKSVDIEDVHNQVPNDEVEIKVQEATESTMVSEDDHGAQKDPSSLQDAQSQSSFDSNASAVDAQSDAADKPTVDCVSSAVEGEEKSDLTVEIAKSSEPYTTNETLLNNAPSEPDTCLKYSTGDTTPQLELISNNTAPCDAKLETTPEHDHSDCSNNSQGITFGSFVYDDLNIEQGVLCQPTEFSSTQPIPENSVLKVASGDGISVSNAKPDKLRVTVSSNDRARADDEASASSSKGSVAGDLQAVGSEVVRRTVYYLIRVPRYDDEKLTEQIKLSEQLVDEKSLRRDAIQREYNEKNTALRKVRSVVEAAKVEEKAARDLVAAKRGEIESAHKTLDLVRKALEAEDLSRQIARKEYEYTHETRSLVEERELLKKIKLLKKQQAEVQRFADDHQQETQQALDRRVEVEEQLKALRIEMDALRQSHSKKKESLDAAWKKFYDERELVDEVYNELQIAKEARESQYKQLCNLRMQRSEKNKNFWRYKDDSRVANDYALAGDKDALERHCVNQSEQLMELWNKDDEFRKEYIRCNTWSTLRRLGTMDGRAVGVNETPPTLVNRVRAPAERKLGAVSLAVERNLPTERKTDDFKSSKKVTEKDKPALPKKAGTSKNSVAETSGRIEIEEEKEVPPEKEEFKLKKVEVKLENEKVKLAKEQEELFRREEQRQKEEEAARLREQRILEEKAKAQEAAERKRKKAEKAQAMAEIRARKEAEQKEKERIKRQKKKEKKKGLVTETAQSEPDVAPEPSPEVTVEPEVTEKPQKPVTKKPQKAALYAKQTKTTKAIPPPLRTRGKRKMQQWLWAVAVVVAVLALFFLGNSNFFRNSKFLNFNPAN